ncbi:MAG: thiamine-phosphate kinase [Candidatus Omnitrophica bacterium]|nr:thiamine-phosphate kinase [Candidatus Omnitrophota bacterium]
MKTLKSLGEFGFIKEIRRWPRSGRKALVGIGDDTAVFSLPRGPLICFTTDTLVEGVHFERSALPRRVGWKSMAVNLSDVAAVGGIPKYAVASITIPKWVNWPYLKSFYSGALDCAGRFGVELVGGDTVKGRELSITISLVGIVEKGELTLRRGAKSGDSLYVTGYLGGSLAGRHLTFSPRLPESRFLVKHIRPTAMMDVSDGLIQDLGHILEESRSGAEIWLDKIPVSRAARKLSAGDRNAALSSACQDGEDFELLFTVSPRKAPVLEKMWPRRFAVRLTKIGRMTAAFRGIIYTDKGIRIARPNWLNKEGYRHF